MSLTTRILSSSAIGLAVLVPLGLGQAPAPQAVDSSPGGWQAAAPRQEISPQFAFNPMGGPKGTGSWAIAADGRDGLHGYWRKAFPVVGGKYYRFSAVRQTQNVSEPRRSAVARIVWQDGQGKSVRADAPNEADSKANLPIAEPEYPGDGATRPDGWTPVSGIYRAPSKAGQGVVELHLQWATNGRIDWAEPTLAESAPPPARKVRLAAIHFRPHGGKTPMDNCRMYEPFIAQAAAQRADLVVLGETITYVGLNKSFTEVAEPVPGPSTSYFAALAKKHGTYIVVGLVEREGHLLYNVAVLIGPDGRIIGKYRKVCLPRGEVEGGLTPGNDYPVFQTKFGKIGMMVCYDGFFPEVARELCNRGAEVIAWPVWGCNPLLASARACENHVYLVSSTYEEATANWALTAVYGHDGKPLAQAEKMGTVVLADVDLSRRFFWRNNLGDFRAEIYRERPVAAADKRD